MAEAGASFWQRNRWLKWVAGVSLVAVAAAAVLVTVALHRVEPFLRAQIVAELEQRFHARVELDDFHMALGGGWRGPWGVWAQGRGLRIWPPAQVAGVTVPGNAANGTGEAAGGSGEPLIRLDEFKFHAPLRYERGKPFHISVVELKGLNIDLPPQSHFGHGGEAAATVVHTAFQGAGGGIGGGSALLSVMVDTVECIEAHLTLETNKPGKLALEIPIAHLRVTGISAATEMGFDAELTNPRPVGTIYTTGKIGPWLVADPGESPLAGKYRFENANLAGFKGIAGILNSNGQYQGTLRDLIVDGTTETPDFRLTHFGNTLELHTRFHAKVDVTTGDTWLAPVDATLGHSHFTAQGQIVRVAAAGAQKRGGHDIALTVHVDRARIEDFLRLTSHSPTPLLMGAVTVKTTVHIPPGPLPLHERLKLKGTFALDGAQFTSEKIQGYIKQLSLRGQGRPKELKTVDASSVESAMEGNFQMDGGVITLPSLTYKVPGALIQLKGTYGVEGGALNFAGTAQLQATVSQMVGGVAGILIKPADRLFKKSGAGTVIPIDIRGTREEPTFGVDIEHFKGSWTIRPGTK